MTEIIEINGDWIGFYTYDKGYSISDRQLKVPFRLTIEKGIKEFIGRIYEEADYGGIADEILKRDSKTETRLNLRSITHWNILLDQMTS